MRIRGFRGLIGLVGTLGALALSGFVSCSGDDIGSAGTLVGGPCSTNGDCTKRCLLGGDFPGGYCSLSCRGDADCPKGTLCIDKQGGVCLLGCEMPAACQGFGAAYRCNPEDRLAMPNVTTPVCIGL